MPLNELLEINKNGSIKNNNAITLIGRGVNLADISEEIDISIKDEDRSGHFGCFGTTQVGKAQPLDASVHTPKGWIQMKDIKCGSIVSLPDGDEAVVLATFPQGVMPIYRIIFEDGRSAEASGEHLWEIHHKHWLPKYKPGVSRAGCARPRILTTMELQKKLESNKGKFYVRLVKPVEKPKQLLPLHPYVLGCILGDCYIGRRNKLLFYNSSPHVVKRILGFLPQGITLKRTGPGDIDYAFKITEGYPLKTILSGLGLSESRSWEKYIPRQYLESSIEDRLELLRGLLDTDGTVTKTGALQFSTSSKHLAPGVQELVWSLGGIAKIRKKRTFYTQNNKRKECKESYCITIRHPRSRDLITRPERRERLPLEGREHSKILRLAVKTINFSRYAEAQCLLTNSKDHLYITDQYIVTHNTRLIENIVEQDIRKGYNVVIIDPKGDVALFSKMVQVAAESGRLQEIMLLTPIYPDYSIMLDPLAYYYMEDELVDHVISGIKAREDYFIAIASEVSQAVISGLALQAKYRGERLNINFADIKARSDQNSLRRFRETIEHLPGSSDVCQGIEQIVASPPDFFAKVSSSLRTTLSALTSGSTGRIIGKSLTNEFVKRFEEGKGVILFCNTGSLLARRTAYIIGRVLVSMIQSMLGRFFASGRRLNPPLCVHIDEGHNILYKGIQELFNKGGAANVWVSFYTQSIAQVEDEIGREAAKSILDNINTWVYMLVNHPDTAQYMEDSSPTIKKYQPILSFGGGISVREIEDKQILAPNVLQLQKRQFYMRSYGKLYKGRTVDVTPAYVKVEFPELSSIQPL